MRITRSQLALVRLACGVGGIALTLVMVVATYQLATRARIAKVAVPVAPVTMPSSELPSYVAPLQEPVAKAEAILAPPVEPDQKVASSLPEERTTPLAPEPSAAPQAASTPVGPSLTDPNSHSGRPLSSRAAPRGEDLRPYAYTSALQGISQRLEPELRTAFNLGRSGALYAARSRFVSVMRKIALAKDGQSGETHHATALAEGLRALEEADDFVPRGDALETELDTRAIAQSHGSRLLEENASPEVSPHEASALYSRFAAERLGEAVRGEEAGSMALFGLGKAYARLASQSDDTSASQKSDVMYRAAIVAHERNYLAANELGVSLSKAGWHEQALGMLHLAAYHHPDATVYQNLASVEKQLGNSAQAIAIAQTGTKVAQVERAHGEVSRKHGVQWVSPEAFRRNGPSPGTNPPPQNARVAMQPSTEAPKRSPWRRMTDYAKRATSWDKQQEPSASTPAYLR